MKLEVELFIYNETFVFGKILKQEGIERTPTGNKQPLASSSNGTYNIRIDDRPAITKNDLYIRGTEEEYDDDVMFYNFFSKEYAEEWLENIKELVQKLNTEGKIKRVL